jgi:hypothetical protein
MAGLDPAIHILFASMGKTMRIARGKASMA